MATTPTREVEFDEDHLDAITASMTEMTEVAAGWINFTPAVEPGHEPPPRTLFATIFSANGDAVPLATWSAPSRVGGRAQIGIEHGSGPKALARLADQQLALPDGWLKLNDHPRRGLVVVTAASATADDVLWWLLAATHALSVVPLTGDWLASIYAGTPAKG